MKQARASAACKHELAQLLPWYANGSLAGVEAQRVAAHLEQCPLCRQELREQEQLRGLMRAPVPLEYTPQAGLRKLMQRIDDAAAATASAPARPRWLAGLAGGLSGLVMSKPRGPVAWLSAAVVLQALALTALLLGLLAGRPGQPAAEGGAAYRTLSSQPEGEARLRVLFAPGVTLAELQALLQAQRLLAVAGPSEAGLFTLALRGSAADEPAAVLARLRADPRVRFAEALAADAAPR